MDALITEGLAKRQRWTDAQAATNSSTKLALLRPFLIPAHDDFKSAYQVWSIHQTILNEVDKTGSASIPFLEGLLLLPCYQNNYNPDWEGFGAQQRVQLQQRLAFQKAAVSLTPEAKLAELRPLFIPAKFHTEAGADPNSLVGSIMDKALADVETIAAPEAIPFLKDILALPYYQENYGMHFGHDIRPKIEAALARLEAKAALNTEVGSIR